MKWEKFNLLTKKQQIEYTYKFKNYQPTFNLTGLFYTVILFIMSLNVMLFTSYLILSHELPNIDDTSGKTILINAFNVSKLLVPIVVFGCVYEIIKISIYYVQKYRWLKKNGQ